MSRVFSVECQLRAIIVHADSAETDDGELRFYNNTTPSDEDSFGADMLVAAFAKGYWFRFSEQVSISASEQ